MIPPDVRQQLNAAHAVGDYRPLLALIPYAGLIGIECERQGEDLLFRLPANPDNIGNPLLPAIHGGVIAGFMELSAALYLLIYSESASIPKVIDFSIDYLRAGHFRDTYAQCQLWRQGRRVTNVAITAWQGDRFTGANGPHPNGVIHRASPP